MPPSGAATSPATTNPPPSPSRHHPSPPPYEPPTTARHCHHPPLPPTTTHYTTTATTHHQTFLYNLQFIREGLVNLLRKIKSHGFAAALAVLITGASQSRQHGKSELDLTSHLLQSLFDVGSGRIFIVIVNTLVSL
ncbi:hypothetical protein Tco_0939147 [Tanacetum coccineum]|uniref:Uncharacterized protein n=1 Tax=Tanacetum coccineum TaxID=301880 RepID=A0ABQ5DJS2_9ASTR